MSNRNNQLFISDVCKLLYNYYISIRSYLDDVPEERRKQELYKYGKKGDFFYQVIKWFSKRTGLNTIDIDKYIEYAGNDYNFGGRNFITREPIPEISPIAQQMAIFHNSGGTDDLLAWIWKEYPTEAKEMGLPYKQTSVFDISNLNNIHNENRETQSEVGATVIGEWSKPMSKTRMMTALRIDSRKKFNSYANQIGIKKAGNRQTFQIRLDTLPKNQREKIEKI